MSAPTPPADPSTPAKPKRRWLRRVLWVVLILIVIVVGAVAALPLYSPALSGTVASQIASATGNPAQLDSLYLSVFGGEARIGDLTLRVPGGAADEVVTLKHAKVTFRPGALLTGGFQVTRAEVKDLTVVLERDAEGTWSLAPLNPKEDDGSAPPAEEPAEPEGEEGEASVIPLEFFDPEKAEISVESVRVVLRDALTGQSGEVTGLGLTVLVSERKKLSAQLEASAPAFTMGDSTVLDQGALRFGAELDISDPKARLEDLSGLITLVVNAARVDLTAFAPEESPADEDPKAPDGDAEKAPEVVVAAAEAIDDTPLEPLDEKIRQLVDRLIVDATVDIGHIQLDETHYLEGAHAYSALNKHRYGTSEASSDEESLGDIGLFGVNAAVLPGAPTPGKLTADGRCDLNQEYPPVTLDYDIQRLPARVSVLRQAFLMAGQFVPVPLLDKFNFADEQRMMVTVKGQDRWIGLDPRTFKKSLRSNREGSVQLPSGGFDLGLDLMKLVNGGDTLETAKGLVTELEGVLTPLQERDQIVSAQLARVEEQVKSLNDTITSLQQKVSAAETLVDTLRPLTLFGGSSAKKKLAKAEAELSRAQTTLAEQKGERSQANQLLNRARDEKGTLDRKIADLEAKIAKERDRVGEKLAVLDDPFEFLFGELGLQFSVDNANPWDGTGGLAALKEAATSRITIRAMQFDKDGRDFPDIGGWWDLDGLYELSLAPSSATLSNLDQKLPPVSNLIRELGGIQWGPDGFDERLFRLLPGQK